MIKINDVIFDKGIIIDIIINPNVSTWCILNTILKNEDVIIIDTQGNITNKINKYKIQNVLNFTIKEVKLISPLKQSLMVVTLDKSLSLVKSTVDKLGQFLNELVILVTLLVNITETVCKEGHPSK